MEKPGRNDPCWCGSGKKYKKCHIDFDEKIEEFEGAGHIVPSHEILKNAEQIEKIKESAKINIAVLDYVAEHIKAGISTAEIDKWVYDITTKMGGVPAPLNFEGFRMYFNKQRSLSRYSVGRCNNQRRRYNQC